MIKHTRISLLFLMMAFIVTTGFSQEWYDLIHQEPVNIEKVKEAAKPYFDKIGRGKHTGYKQYQRWLEKATMNMDKNGVPYTQNHIADELKKFRANSVKKGKQARAAVQDADGIWTVMGPFYTDQNNKDAKKMAKIDALAVEPIHQQLLFASSTGSGIWRSRDAGASWTPLGDQFDVMYVKAVALDPHNVNHVVYLNGNSEVFESLDQGDTWSQVTNLNSGVGNSAKMIKFHPTTANIYFVTTANSLMKTTNGGASFTKVVNGEINDVFFKPGDPTTMYSAGKDFWKSTDTGATWTKITNGISVSDLMKIAVTPADPDRVYILQADGNAFRQIYKSTNSGDSFTVMAEADNVPDNFLGKQAYRCMTIMGSITDPDRLDMAGLLHYRSDDGGATLYEVPGSQITSDPADIHADVLTMTNVNGTLYATSDGGIFRSTDNGVTYIPLTGNGLIATEIYRMGGTSPYPGTGENVDPDMVIIGCQDNGTSFARGTDHIWEYWGAGDGLECFIDYTDDMFLYGSSQSSLIYSDDGGILRRTLTKPEYRPGFITPSPYTMDPFTHTTIYWGYTDLYISKNSGQDWENMTEGYTADDAHIKTIAVSPTDNNYIYFGENYRLWKSSNAQSNSREWTEIGDFSDSRINYITIDPNDPLHVLTANTGSEIFESKDGGETWADISGNLPDITANCVLMDNSPENTIYVGMFQGVYYKNDNMTDWELFGNGLPNADVRELEIHYASKKLRVATYGRGIWEIPIFGTGNDVSPEVIAETVEEKCSGDSVLLSVTENVNWKEPLSYKWFKNDVLISDATGSNYYALQDGDYTVEVTANEVSGTSNEITINFIDALEAPSIEDETICTPGLITLETSGTENGIIRWYSDTEGTDELAEGNTFSVDISETSTFYVKETPSISIYKIGLEDNSDFDGAYTVGGNNLVIDVESEFILNSVKVYAEEAGDRTFEVRDANAELLVSKTVFVEVGESRVNLGFTVPVGDDLSVGIEEDGLRLYRSNGDINYPFVVEGVVTIKGSSLRSTLYYSLYDWEIQTGSTLCTSPSSEVTVTLDNCVGLSTYENENLTLFPNPTTGLVHLKLPEGFDLTKIEVTNIQGNRLLSYDEYVEQIDLQSFKSGTYLIKVSGEQGTKMFKVEVR